MSHNEDERIEDLMRRVTPVGPSPGLRERVLGAAAAAWHEGQPRIESVDWRTAVWRLPGSVAAAVLVMLSAGWTSDWALAKWQAQPEMHACGAPPTDWPESVEGMPLPRHLARVKVTVLPADARNRFLQYRQSIREMLEQPEQDPTREQKPSVERQGRA